MDLQSALSIFAGGPGSGCNPDAGQCGRKGSKSDLAKDSYVPVTSAKIKVSKDNEIRVAKSIGGESMRDNHPFDVTVGKIGIEVKTIFPGVHNDKITMHPESRERKFESMKSMKLKKAFTVAIDERTKKVYVADGLKSFRLRNMTEIKSMKQLKDFIK